MVVTEAERLACLQRLRDSTEPDQSQLHDAIGVICRECFDPVQPEILQANPRAVRCLDCAMEYQLTE
ncbi:hypothetical protein [Methylogaea oryzae]|uniref:DksA C4-type domain-containing protein n=1 Tax=Methylogaea oryzae TaxID=1295382 RepID=A0A8D4VN93_9GAMM|nr:hypothetical protein [Methylogaea oryzae]BBL70344.1 hypothetical protein MoryE10_09500 [Methylogaea oryzae]